MLPPWPASTYALLDVVILAVGAALVVLSVYVFGKLEGNFAEEL